MLTTGWYYADPLISAGIGLFIFPRTWLLLREAVGILLEGTPSDVNLVSLREAMNKVTGVAGIHDLHVWTLTSGINAMSVHAVLAEGALHDDVRLLFTDKNHRTFEFYEDRGGTTVSAGGCRSPSCVLRTPSASSLPFAAGQS